MTPWLEAIRFKIRVFLEARLLGIDGRWEHVDGISRVIAHRLTDMSALLGSLDSRSRDFH